MRTAARMLMAGAGVVLAASLAAEGPSGLTALDFYQIHDLDARFCYALDTGDGRLLASLFTADGVFVDENGRASTGAGPLAALADATPGKGPTNLSHFYVNLATDPAPGGATAKSYINTSTPRPGEALSAIASGQYWDDLVKTANGWRLKRRTFYKSGTPRPASQPLATTVPRFTPASAAASPTGGVTADDYAQIRQLYARFAEFWDSPTNGGRSWADLFSADGVFVDAAGRGTAGRAKLQEVVWTKGDWDRGSHVTNVMVEPIADGVFAAKVYYVRHRVTAAQFLSESNVPVFKPAVPEFPSETFFGLDASQPGPDQPAALLVALIARTAEGLRFKKLALVKPHAALPAMPQEKVTAVARPPVNASPLSATDYAEIEHVYARYAHGIDSKADNGDLFGSVYLPDAFFRAEFDNYVTPREKLMQTYARTPTGVPAPIVAGGHQTYNIVIEPAPWGAYGTAYMGNGGYEDTLVKLPEGWRFKARNYRWAPAFPGARVDRPQTSR